MAVVDEKAGEVGSAHRPPWWLWPARWWQELLIIGVGFGVYTLIQHHINVSPEPAMRNAHGIMRLEGSLGLAVERPLNQWLAGHDLLAMAANDWYIVMHELFTPIVILWVYRRHRDLFPYGRFLLAVPTLIGFVLFYATPVAPPRLLPGMVDTLQAFPSLGSYSQGPMSHTAAQFAAFPSLHVAWALWCAAMLWLAVRRWYARVLAVCYPICTSLVVVVTANHYVMDVVGGAAVFGFGVGLLWLLRLSLANSTAVTLVENQPVTEP